MNTFIKRILLLNILFMVFSCASPGVNEGVIIIMKTTLGDIKLKLYDETPIHRDNFVKLVNSGFYDGISFHRVVRDFVIQAGDPETRKDKKGLSDTLSTYTIPAEFRPEYFHKRGALGAAREGNDVNPDMRSSGTQFYIVQGKKYTEDEINSVVEQTRKDRLQSMFNKFSKEIADSASKTGKEMDPAQMHEVASMKMFEYMNSEKSFKISAGHRASYIENGGIPRLDGAYTVFGEVIEGMDIVDRIASVPVNSEKPVTDVRILKMRIANN